VTLFQGGFFEKYRELRGRD